VRGSGDGYESDFVRKCYGILSALERWAWERVFLRFHAMSEEQLKAPHAKLREDAELQEKFKGAQDLDAAVAIAREAGFDVSKADWLRHQAKQTLELSDEELERVAGGDCYETYYSIHHKTLCMGQAGCSARPRC
jgi:predicted ribosomally synthesized peptide with nif11-like leader